MKKLFAILLTVALIVSAVCVLAACNGNKTDVAAAIEAAEKMTLEELEAASKKEFEDNPDAVFNADSLTSGIKKALSAFAEKYDWLNFANSEDVKENPDALKGKNAVYNSKKVQGT